MYVTVSPAYGRDYTSQKAAKADWAAGKDFVIQSIETGAAGRMVSKSEAPASWKIMIRYARMTKVVQA